VYGGAGVAEQIAALRAGVHVVVCTPGRMIDLLCANGGRVTNMQRVTYICLDEADRMFDMGFEPQIMKIIGNSRPDRQTVLFSATFPPQVETLAKQVLERPVEVTVGGRSTVNADIVQVIEVRTAETKFHRLLQLLGKYYERGHIIVFVDKQDTCDELFMDLTKQGYPCTSLHGGKDQADRDTAINQFKNGIFNLLIATSVAARGLDVKSMVLVVNFDVPTHFEDYVHRVGRTGRAGRKGTAVTFIAPDEERHAPELVKALNTANKKNKVQTKIPGALTKLSDSYLEKKKAGTAKMKSSGFGGSGFKFDVAEHAKNIDGQMADRAKYGVVEGAAVVEGEGAAGVDMSDATNPLVMALKALDAVGTSGFSSAASSPRVVAPTGNSVLDKAQAAIAAAGKDMINVKADLNSLMRKQAMMNQLTKSIQPGDHQAYVQALLQITGKGPSLGMTADRELARLKAQNYAAIINAQASNAKEEAEYKANEATMAHEFEFIINDFPQHVRWRITHKDAMQQINDFTGAAITVRGNYLPPDQAVTRMAAGERKLFLYVEAPDGTALTKAKNELKRIITEIMQELAQKGKLDEQQQSTQGGRYAVV